MKGNIVLAAAVFAAGVIIASIILVFGIQSALNDAMLHLDASVQTHAKSVERAGETISRLQLTIKSPVDIAQPLRIEGTRKDGSVLVNAQPLRVEGTRKDGSVLVNARIAQPLRVEGTHKDGSVLVNARIAK